MSLSRPAITRTLLLYGPSQYGKSTFINNFIKLTNAPLERADVGNNSGNSITCAIKAYNVGSIPELFPEDIAGYDTVTIIDAPGIFDSRLFSNDEILKEIKLSLLNSKKLEIDAILVFESLRDDALQINNCVHIAANMFGTNITKNMIVIATKWDLIKEPRLSKKTQTLETYLANLQIEYIKWKNVWKSDPNAFENDMKIQLSELGGRIKRAQSYRMEEMIRLIEKRDELARVIQSNDPQRLSEYEIVIDVHIPEEYTELVLMKVTEWVPLTEEEKKDKANKFYEESKGLDQGYALRATGRKIAKEKIVGFKERREKRRVAISNGMFRGDKVIRWEDIFQDPIKETFYEDELEIVKLEEMKMPLEHFLRAVSNDAKPITTEKFVPMKKVRPKIIQQVIGYNQERYGFEHYQQLATEEIEREMRYNIRSIITNS
ncbi:hypothetical protein SteCoe_9337 [Stentor coeruleus]|uniref:AIG1-type G domain-containing protein n=1 Tax=Stentor coeruleus TaxID=5963 RepID=A0A1R2CHZ0_9CILI|nr:hypothetical protein SteCoe_9337 [Stentor coeruleus]